MAREIRNRAASIKQQLSNLARREGRVFEIVMVRYALERLLYRLSVSDKADRFILKGGMLVTLWLDGDNRETRDVDFLGYGQADGETLRSIFAAIMAAQYDDGLVFDVGGLQAEVIREDMEYNGVRLRTVALLERTRIPVTIDIGFGDALTGAEMTSYPSLLGMESPRIRSYPPAVVIAEKFQAMVQLGIINGRMKDYFDLWAIPQVVSIPDRELDAAIRATFERRRTPIPSGRPPGLSGVFFDDTGKQTQWRNYARSIQVTNLDLGEVTDAIWTLVGPSCARLIAESGSDKEI
ncbi:nucleotidyl transferase AbiEii/AbiGii toxin family protein (plasmid) [Agrobacterium salinitolerans]|uniref:nucleotidyl transferase AbiEii/AbiGii toxin family protein n=1 Tax=Agrobacterium salinitolerans TaxID=1183413 RepID=UPI001C24C8E6|nr:nucleotidyl transferase AbiEii/AbiGii toxin family protein [Agrobacterium salinitolerans]QXC52607.1 nucleotidyl transferase AbiEii/AbiGii toxin family protein [Agrobacterium salinitolerans]